LLLRDSSTFPAAAIPLGELDRAVAAFVAAAASAPPRETLALLRPLSAQQDALSPIAASLGFPAGLPPPGDTDDIYAACSPALLLSATIADVLRPAPIATALQTAIASGGTATSPPLPGGSRAVAACFAKAGVVSVLLTTISAPIGTLCLPLSAPSGCRAAAAAATLASVLPELFPEAFRRIGVVRRVGELLSSEIRIFTTPGAVASRDSDLITLLSALIDLARNRTTPASVLSQADADIIVALAALPALPAVTRRLAYAAIANLMSPVPEPAVLSALSSSAPALAALHASVLEAAPNEICGILASISCAELMVADEDSNALAGDFLDSLDARLAQASVYASACADAVMADRVAVLFAKLERARPR
jgi:hypothetical protein